MKKRKTPGHTIMERLEPRIAPITLIIAVDSTQFDSGVSAYISASVISPTQIETRVELSYLRWDSPAADDIDQPPECFREFIVDTVITAENPRDLVLEVDAQETAGNLDAFVSQTLPDLTAELLITADEVASNVAAIDGAIAEMTIDDSWKIPCPDFDQLHPSAEVV